MKVILLDIETNGLDPKKHHPLELAFIVKDYLKDCQLCSYESKVCLSEKQWLESDPESLKVNGFQFTQIQEAPSLKDIEKDIKTLFHEHELYRGHAFFLCQNPSFDRAFFAHFVSTYEQERLQWPYHWLDLASVYLGKYPEKIFQEAKKGNFSLSKNRLAQSMGLPPEENPHKAMNGVKHLQLCFEKLVSS